MKPKNASWPQPSATAKRASAPTVSTRDAATSGSSDSARKAARRPRCCFSSRNPPIAVRKWPTTASCRARARRRPPMPRAVIADVGRDRQRGEDHPARQDRRREPAGVDQARDHDRDVDAEVRHADQGAGQDRDVLGQRGQQRRGVERLEGAQRQHQRAADQVHAELGDRALSQPDHGHLRGDPRRRRDDAEPEERPGHGHRVGAGRARAPARAGSARSGPTPATPAVRPARTDRTITPREARRRNAIRPINGDPRCRPHRGRHTATGNRRSLRIERRHRRAGGPAALKPSASRVS